jgi:hypothetical protein
MAFRKGIGENGNLSDSVLQKIDTGQKLYIPAAVSFMRMKNDAKKQGVNIELVGKDSGYRRCGEKGDYTKRKCSDGFTQWCAWEKYRAGVGNLASNPTDSDGCSSNHGYGMAIDVKNSNAKRWIRLNGTKYGWWWGEAPSEDWHFTYDLNKDTFLNNKDIPEAVDNEIKISDKNINEKNINEKNTIIFPLILILSGLGLGAYFYFKFKKRK